MPNDFTNEDFLVARWRFESGALTTDSTGNHVALSQDGTITAITDHREGNYAADFGAAARYYLTNANLHDDMPGKTDSGNPASLVIPTLPFEGSLNISFVKVANLILG